MWLFYALYRHLFYTGRDTSNHDNSYSDDSYQDNHYEGYSYYDSDCEWPEDY